MKVDATVAPVLIPRLDEAASVTPPAIVPDLSVRTVAAVAADRLDPAAVFDIVQLPLTDSEDAGRSVALAPINSRVPPVNETLSPMADGGPDPSFIRRVSVEPIEI